MQNATSTVIRIGIAFSNHRTVSKRIDSIITNPARIIKEIVEKEIYIKIVVQCFDEIRDKK